MSVSKSYGKSKPGIDPNITIFIQKKYFIIFIVLHLTSVIQNIPLHLCVSIFEKEIQKIRIQTLRSFSLRQPLSPNSKETLVRGASTERSQTSSPRPPFSSHLQEERWTLKKPSESEIAAIDQTGASKTRKKKVIVSHPL